MKKIYILISILVTFYGISSQAQPVSYTIDSTCYSALIMEGGTVKFDMADINLDGHPDLLTVGDHGSPGISGNAHGISVFFGNGTGTGWTLYQNGNFGYGGISVGDINN